MAFLNFGIWRYVITLLLFITLNISLLLSCANATRSVSPPGATDNPRSARPDHSIILVPVDEGAQNSENSAAFLSPDTKDYLIPADIYIGELQDSNIQSSPDREIYNIVRNFTRALISDNGPIPNLSQSDSNEIQEEVNALRALDAPPQSVRVGRIKFNSDNRAARTALHIQSSEGHTKAFLYVAQQPPDSRWVINRFVIQRDAINTLTPQEALPFDFVIP